MVKDAAQKSRLIRAFYDGIARAHDSYACFNPRHGLRATRGKRTVDLVICLQCRSVECYYADQRTGGGISPAPYAVCEHILGLSK